MQLPKPMALGKAPGYSLVEVVVVLLIFTMMFLVMLSVFNNGISRLNDSKVKIIATEIASAQMEILRNINYIDLGTVSGSPAGAIPQTKQVTRSNINFTVTTTVKYFDDPFDGCAGEAGGGKDPAEWSRCADGTEVNVARDIPTYLNNPADYKKCDVEVSWESPSSPDPIKLSTIIAPPDLEGETDKGFLLIEVLDADGAPVADANVHVTNSTVVPNVDIAMSTDSFGRLLLLDLEPSQYSYVITVTKDGYSTDRTCSEDAAGTTCSDSEGVPDPYLEDVSVHEGELEEKTFFIDQLSTLSVNSYTQECAALDAIDLTLQGLDKQYSVSPEILKNVIDLETDSGSTPHWASSEIEWNHYDLIINTAGYHIAGINHDLALNILPNTDTTVNVLLSPQTANALLVTVKDSGTETNLSNANVRVVNSSQSFDESRLTGQGFIEQTDWSGGSGQADFIDASKYFSDDTHIDGTTTGGQVTLDLDNSVLPFTETFQTASQKDEVNTTADWNTSDEELKLPTSAGMYPTGEMHYAQTAIINASQHGHITAATLSATEELNGKTANYFLSADGGTNFENVTLGSEHSFSNAGSDLRIRVELETDDEDVTPKVLDMSLSYSIEYYDEVGELVSSTFDIGEAASNSQFTTILWDNASQPPETGTESVRFQIASNTDNSTWNFIGPDGTSGTYFTDGSGDIDSSHDGDRYIRYKLYLSTDDIYYTPVLTNVRIGYTLECLPPGQAYFDGMAAEDHVIEVTMDGYEDSNVSVSVSGYTTEEVLLTPTI
ncbi:MAG: carboxypeptidase-like regulatory domain-containing protein [Patescibacteria group bacterium]